MSSGPIMKAKHGRLLRPYRTALCQYLTQRNGDKLQPALKLGRQAVELGLETLDLALIHEQVLIAHVLTIRNHAERARTIQRARAFFAEAIVPLEETHRSAVETNADLSRLNRALSRRTQDLAASNRELKGEIARRYVVESTLRRSEQQARLLLDQSRHLQEQLKRLSRRILSVQEEERRKISRELHDVIAQVLTGINVRLATLKMNVTTNRKSLTTSITRTQRLVERSVDIVHQFARELRPAVLDDLGVIPALHSFLKSFASETRIRVSLTAFAGVEKLSNAKRTVLYRVAQEALTNVGRHAEASRVDVTIQRIPRGVRMRVKDNGHSFRVDRVAMARKGGHLGLLGMRERVEMVGGSFAVESEPGKGTTIQADIPFAGGARE